MFSIYAKFLTMNNFCREITAQKLTKGNSDIAEWILIQKLVSEKKVSKNKDGRRETKRFLGPRVTPSMNKKFAFLLIDDYTSIIGILCRSTLDLHSFIVLVLGQMNELFKMAFKRLRQLFELFWWSKAFNAPKNACISTYPSS